MLLRLVTLVGLGIAAGAVLQPGAGAQDTTRTRRDTTVAIPIPPQPDTIVRRDSAARGDVPAPDSVRIDTIQPLFARAELPRLVDAARVSSYWGRDSILATGAITLADLLDRLPGVTPLRTTWYGLPAVAAYMGDVSRVRVFLDGLELDPYEPRGGRAFDVTRVPLWALEDLSIEQTAGEIRVHARSWQADRTTPYSRADIATGDQDTDLIRFFFGRRFGNGLGLQAAVQQYGMTPDRFAGTTSEISLMARVGWARREWQADAMVFRDSPRRGVQRDLSNDSIPSLDLTRTQSYARVGYGDVDGPLWVQAIAGALGYWYGGALPPPVPGDTVPPQSVDTSRFQAQYALTGGITRGLLRASATHRIRVIEGTAFHTPSARVSGGWQLLEASLTAEGQGIDSISRADAAVRAAPLPFLRVGGSAAVRRDARDGGTTGADLRAEGAVRLLDLWLGGGLMSRAETRLPPAESFNRGYVEVVGPAAQGAFATVQGRVWGPIQLDLLGEAWTDEGLSYRPRFHTRSDVFVRSNFLGRFPRGNFGLYGLVRHEYRSATFFPLAEGFERTAGHRMYTGLLEIRILDATLSYQFRNMLGAPIQMVPRYQMPRQTQFYGVRWTFWN